MLWRWRQEDWEFKASLGSTVNASLELYKVLSQINLEMGAQEESIQVTAEGSSSRGVRLHAPCVVYCKALPPFGRKDREVTLLSV